MCFRCLSDKGYSLMSNELKLAKVLPIYISDDKRQLKNYRPISVLSFIFKIFDSVIDFLDDHDILYNK